MVLAAEAEFPHLTSSGSGRQGRILRLAQDDSETFSNVDEVEEKKIHLVILQTFETAL